MVVLISGCVMMAKGMSDAMYCILTVQGWVHDRAGLGARLYRAGCTTVQDWVHSYAWMVHVLVFKRKSLTALSLGDT